ncbi:LysR family transcriptional regulator [Pendulispora rubella]|uniref:LysR family transcriptional regulator n=1 Tax=Pendulispora rubella TaxID=2741070 RepID=A0ABZ2LBR9_9BACT
MAATLISPSTLENGQLGTRSDTFSATMELEEVAAFLALVEAGSVFRAAKNMKISRATFRRRLEALEENIGQRLYERERDKIVLTRAGRLLEQEGPLLLGSARRLTDALKQTGTETVSGKLWIAMPIGLPDELLAAFAREIAERWPRLRVVSHFSADPLSELERDADMAITAGNRPRAPWVSRSIAQFEEYAVAHRSYVERAGLPRSLEELRQHRLLSQQAPDVDPARWPLRGGGTHRVQPSLTVNDLGNLLACVNAGIGIGLLPTGNATSELRTVLPEIIGRRRRFWLASAPAGRWSPAVRAFSEALVTFLASNQKR